MVLRHVQLISFAHLSFGLAAAIVRRMSDIYAIIPAFGRSDLLARCLAALLDAGFGPAQIVVVDDASPGPEVAETAERHGARLVRLDVNAGPAGARNAGARAAAGADVLFFIDSDVLASPDVRSCIEAALSDRSIAAVFGCYDDRPAETDLVSLYVNLRHREVHRRSAGPADTFWAGCGAVRRAAFDAVGGFDPDRRWNFIEDVEFGRRLRRAGYAIRLDPALQGKHLKRWTLRLSARTDALYRARPWIRLMLDETRMMRGLNADSSGKASMVAVAAIPLCLLAAIWWRPGLLLALLALLAIPVMNRGLFTSFARLRGWGFAAACVPLHAFHLGCVAAGLALGLAGRLVAGGRAPLRSAADLELENAE